MPGLIDAGAAILLSAERRLEASAQNVANASTTGFKRQASFSQALKNAARPEQAVPSPVNLTDFSQGRLTETGSPLDLAIYGSGLFLLRDGDHLVYSRGGSFTRAEGGLLADAEGRILQQDGGGDLAVESADFSVLDDGTVLEGGLPTARIGLYEASDPAALKAIGGATFAADPASMEPAQDSQVRQGFSENSNVVMSDEMIAMMSSVRQAEGGARLVQFYDELIGQAITTFSKGSR